MVRKKLGSQYFVKIDAEHLCLDFNAEPELRLVTARGEFSLVPPAEELFDPRQMLLPFPDYLEVCRAASQYSTRFVESLEVMKQFPANKLAVASYCVCFGAPAFDLFADCPGLAYLSAVHFSLQPDNWEGRRRFSPQKKRRKLLVELGFPGTKSMVKVFRKIPTCDFQPQFFHELKEVFQAARGEDLKVLCHVQRVNHVLLKTMAMEGLRPFMRAGFFDEVSRLENLDDSFFLHEIMGLEQAIYIVMSGRGGLQVPLLRSLADLEELHERYVLYLNGPCDYKGDELKNLRFPDPPFPGRERLKNYLARLSRW